MSFIIANVYGTLATYYNPYLKGHENCDDFQNAQSG